MSLSPLPPSTLYDAGQCLNGHNNDSLRAYGKACREQAIEDVINCYSTDDTAQDFIDKIRNLK